MEKFLACSQMNVLHSIRKWVSPKESSKPAVQTKQPSKKKENQKIIALFSEETEVLKHKLKIHKTSNKTYELKQTNVLDSH